MDAAAAAELDESTKNSSNLAHGKFSSAADYFSSEVIAARLVKPPSFSNHSIYMFIESGDTRSA